MIKSVRYKNFKALNDFQITLHDMNVLVGPNNAGKSTVLDGFRALEGAIRYARRYLPRRIRGPNRQILHGYEIPDSSLQISTANIHSDYVEIETSVSFTLQNDNKLDLLFNPAGKCILCLDDTGKPTRSTKDFAVNYPLKILCVPTLGPFEEEETYLEDQTVQRNAGSRRAHRMFRNIWYRNRENFSKFKEIVESTWPGMSIQAPEILDYQTRQLGMYCREGRIDREIYWSGFGFQIWLQFMTHLLHSSEDGILVIDEPDIYLHPDLQHRLFTIARTSSKQVVLATHSVEIINEAEHDEVVLINKTARHAKRVNDIEGLQQAISSIGSAQNIHLARLSKNKKVLFFEGEDFKIVRRLAAKLGLRNLADEYEITVIPIGGFTQWRKVEDAAWTFEKILQTQVRIAALFDRDYRSDEEISQFLTKIRKSTPDCFVLPRKEIENYLLDEEAIHRAVADLMKRRNVPRRKILEEKDVQDLLNSATERHRSTALSQTIGERIKFFSRSSKDPSTISKEAFQLFEDRWADREMRLSIVPGKLVLASLNTLVQEQFAVSLSTVQIIRHIRAEVVPTELRAILSRFNTFASA